MYYFKQCGVKMSLGITKTTINHEKKTGLHPKMMMCIWWELEGHCLLQIPSAKSDIKFRQVLFSIKLIKVRNE